MNSNNLENYLRLFLAKGIGQRTFMAILLKLRKLNKTIDDFLSLSVDDWITVFNLRPEVASNLALRDDKLEFLIKQIEEKKINFVIWGDKDYPMNLINSLGTEAPPVIWYSGNIKLIKKKAIGFCGSRNASQRGIEVAVDSASQLATHGFNIVSGYARGIDMAVHKAALNCNGITTIVLAEGILNFRVKAEIKDIFNINNVLILSEFSPKLSWSAHNAMDRNKTICGLSDAIIIIESGLKGGTFNAGETALKLKKPLFVTNYFTPDENALGNEYFIKKGAFKLMSSKTTKKASVQQLIDILNTQQIHSHVIAEQISFLK